MLGSKNNSVPWILVGDEDLPKGGGNNQQVISTHGFVKPTWPQAEILGISVVEKSYHIPFSGTCIFLITLSREVDKCFIGTSMNLPHSFKVYFDDVFHTVNCL